MWPPSTEVIPKLWAIIREPIRNAGPPAATSPQRPSPAAGGADHDGRWPAFMASFDRSTPLASLTLSAAAAWKRDTDYDLFLRILFVLIYKTALPFNVSPPSPLLPLPASSSASSPLPGPPSRPRPSPGSGPHPAAREKDASPAVALPLGLSPPPAELTAAAAAAASYSCYPYVRPAGLYVHEASMRKFSSAVHQSSWVARLLSPADRLCLAMLLGLESEARPAFVGRLKAQANGTTTPSTLWSRSIGRPLTRPLPPAELMGAQHGFAKARALLQAALFCQVFSMDVSVRTLEV